MTFKVDRILYDFQKLCEVTIEEALGHLRCDCLDRNVALIKQDYNLFIHFNDRLIGSVKVTFNMEENTVKFEKWVAP